jgi:hypothetical protein
MGKMVGAGAEFLTNWSRSRIKIDFLRNTFQRKIMSGTCYRSAPTSATEKIKQSLPCLSTFFAAFSSSSQ